MLDWYHLIRGETKFSFRELLEITITSIFFGLILFMWRYGKQDVNIPIMWLFFFVLAFLALFWSVLFQKIFSLWPGYKTHYYTWYPGVFLGVLISFLSFGLIPFLYPGNSYYEHVKKWRLGHFRHGINFKDMAVPAVAGVYSNLLLALILSFVYVSTNNFVVGEFMKVNLLYAFYSLWPIPRINGSKLEDGSTPAFYILYFARQLYIFVVVSVIVFALLIWFSNSILSNILILLGAIILGLIVMFIYLGRYHK